MKKYYSYHATAKKLIAQGELVGYEFYGRWNRIDNALVLYFKSHRPMPIRENRQAEYIELLGICGDPESSGK